MKTLLVPFLMIVTGLSVSVAAEKEKNGPKDTISLFDGKSLGKWEKVVFGGDGEIKIKDEELHFGFGALMTGVKWKGEPPATNNYEISLEAAKLDGDDFFLGLTFPVDDSFATLVLGGWGGGVVGISSLNGLDASENETATVEYFENDKWYKIRLRVEPERIQTWIDDEKVIDVDIKGVRIGMRPGDIELCVPLGIASYQTRAAYRNIEWKNLSKE